MLLYQTPLPHARDVVFEDQARKGIAIIAFERCMLLPVYDVDCIGSCVLGGGCVLLIDISKLLNFSLNIHSKGNKSLFTSYQFQINFKMFKQDYVIASIPIETLGGVSIIRFCLDEKRELFTGVEISKIKVTFLFPSQESLSLCLNLVFLSRIVRD